MRFDRRAFGPDLRLAEFLVAASVFFVAAFAVWAGVCMTLRDGTLDGLGASFVFLVGGGWVMAVQYVVAIIPSIFTWGLTMHLAKAGGMSADSAVRIAAPLTALVASLLLLTWLSDLDYREMVLEIAIISMLTSIMVVLRLPPPLLIVQAGDASSRQPSP